VVGVVKVHGCVFVLFFTMARCQRSISLVILLTSQAVALLRGLRTGQGSILGVGLPALGNCLRISLRRSSNRPCDIFESREVEVEGGRVSKRDTVFQPGFSCHTNLLLDDIGSCVVCKLSNA
jgi:hypothetical protein